MRAILTLAGLLVLGLCSLEPMYAEGGGRTASASELHGTWIGAGGVHGYPIYRLSLEADSKGLLASFDVRSPLIAWRITSWRLVGDTLEMTAEPVQNATAIRLSGKLARVWMSDVVTLTTEVGGRTNSGQGIVLRREHEQASIVKDLQEWMKSYSSSGRFNRPASQQNGAETGNHLDQQLVAPSEVGEHARVLIRTAGGNLEAYHIMDSAVMDDGNSVQIDVLYDSSTGACWRHVQYLRAGEEVVRFDKEWQRSFWSVRGLGILRVIPASGGLRLQVSTLKAGTPQQAGAVATERLRQPRLLGVAALEDQREVFIRLTTQLGDNFFWVASDASPPPQCEVRCVRRSNSVVIIELTSGVTGQSATIQLDEGFGLLDASLDSH